VRVREREGVGEGVGEIGGEEGGGTVDLLFTVQGRHRVRMNTVNQYCKSIQIVICRHATPLPMTKHTGSSHHNSQKGCEQSL